MRYLPAAEAQPVAAQAPVAASAPTPVDVPGRAADAAPRPRQQEPVPEPRREARPDGAAAPGAVWHHRAESPYAVAPTPVFTSGLTPPPGPPPGTVTAPPAAPSGQAPRRSSGRPPRKRAGAGGLVAIAFIVVGAVWGIGHGAGGGDHGGDSASQAADPGSGGYDDAYQDGGPDGDAADDGSADDGSDGTEAEDAMVPQTTGSHTLLLQVAGDFPDVDIDYSVGDDDGWDYYSHAPWSQQLAYDGTSDVFIDATFYVQQTEKQPMICMVTVDGVVVMTKTVDPEQAFVECEYSPAG